MKISRRAERIEPFYVMEVAKAAQTLAREVAGSSTPVVFLNIGEPDFTAPPLVQEAAARAIYQGATQYTPSLGLDALRERISGWYAQRFGVDVPARRIVGMVSGYDQDQGFFRGFTGNRHAIGHGVISQLTRKPVDLEHVPTRPRITLLLT